MIRAVRAILEEEAYVGRFEFEIYDWEHEKSVVARASYSFGPDKHGLALVSSDGTLLSVRPGHDYGPEEIRADFDKALGREGAGR